jgi:hypothetical protein
MATLWRVCCKSGARRRLALIHLALRRISPEIPAPVNVNGGVAFMGYFAQRKQGVVMMNTHTPKHRLTAADFDQELLDLYDWLN